MSWSNIILPPYPVQIGSLKFETKEKQLHEYVKNGSFEKIKKLLKKGIEVDSTNSLGQTPLFVAALLGLQKIVDLLLKSGANPNHRCCDWSTPVHAAAFSCNQWILSNLIDAGGDLRLHDQKCRRPCEWALMAGTDQSAQMLKFIDRCTAHMQALIHCYPLKPIQIVSSRELIISPSLFDLLSLRNSDKQMPRCHQFKSFPTKKACSFGFGQFCLKDDSQAGFILTIPFTEDKSIVQEDSKPLFSFSAGPYMTMTNLVWESTEVTVKGLNEMAHENFGKDLLIAEQENISNLQHPSILQLLAVCTSPSLERARLVFERVTFGSLYNILHERRSEFPVLHMETIIHLLLQIVDALLFLHWRGFIHRSLSSHAIQIVSEGKAKLSNFEYMIESINKEFNNCIHFPVPEQLYCWSPPEVVLGKPVTTKSDLYSLCAVIQESLTESFPWNGLDGPTIKNAMQSGHYLSVDPRLFQPYISIVCTGIHFKPKDRTITFQEIRYLLKKDLKHMLNTSTSVNDGSGNGITGTCSSKEQPFPLDTFENVAGNSSFNKTKMSSSLSESNSGTLYGITDSVDGHVIERKSGRKTEELTLNSPSATSSVICVSEPSTGPNSEEEGPSSENEDLSDDLQTEFEALENAMTSVKLRNRTTRDNLAFIQNFLQENNVECTEKTTKHYKSLHGKNHDVLSTTSPSHKPTDEVDSRVPVFSDKPFTGWSAIAPPLQYIPPDIASCSGGNSAQASRQTDIRHTERERSIIREERKKNEYCGGNVSSKVKFFDKPCANKTNIEYTKRTLKNSDDDRLVINRFNLKSSSDQQWPTDISCRRKSPLTRMLKSGKEEECKHLDNKDENQPQGSSKYLSQEDKEDTLEKLFYPFAEHRFFMNDAAAGSLLHALNLAASGRGFKYTYDKEYGGTAKETMPLRESDKTDKDKDLSVCSSETNYFTPELELSAENSEQEVLHVCKKSEENSKLLPEEYSMMCSGNDRISEKNLVIDTNGERIVEKTMTGITTPTRSIIDVEELSRISWDCKDLTISKTTETSAKHSTPVISGSYKDVLIESYCLLNKTDCECRSMDITTLTNETGKHSRCGQDHDEMAEENKPEGQRTS